jgi:hypothetical protein
MAYELLTVLDLEAMENRHALAVLVKTAGGLLAKARHRKDVAAGRAWLYLWLGVKWAAPGSLLPENRESEVAERALAIFMAGDLKDPDVVEFGEELATTFQEYNYPGWATLVCARLLPAYQDSPRDFKPDDLETVCCILSRCIEKARAAKAAKAA